MVHAHDPHGQGIVDWRTQIELRPHEIVAATFKPEVTRQLPVCDFCDAVDQAANTATAEYHRVWPFENFEPLDIVQVTICLDVVARPVDEKVASGRIAAKNECLAIALALCRKYAGHITDGFANVVGCLILDLPDGYHIYSLGRIDQRRIRTHRRTAIADLISTFRFLATLDDDDPAIFARLINIIRRHHGKSRRGERQSRNERKNRGRKTEHDKPYFVY